MGKVVRHLFPKKKKKHFSLLKVNLVTSHKFQENCVWTKIDNFEIVLYINAGIYELQHEVINLA